MQIYYLIVFRSHEMGFMGSNKDHKGLNALGFSFHLEAVCIHWPLAFSNNCTTSASASTVTSFLTLTLYFPLSLVRAL